MKKLTLAVLYPALFILGFWAAQYPRPGGEADAGLRPVIFDARVTKTEADIGISELHAARYAELVLAGTAAPEACR